MAYILPTLAEFRVRYPEFTSVADETVSAWLVDHDAETAGWPEDSRARVVMLLTAHRLANISSGAIPAGVTSFRSGSFSATISDSAASRTGFSSTVYGREYLTLLRARTAGPRLAWTPPTHV